MLEALATYSHKLHKKPKPKVGTLHFISSHNERHVMQVNLSVIRAEKAGRKLLGIGIQVAFNEHV